MVRLLKLFMSAINKLCECVTALMLVVMTLSILFQVICRFFGTGYDWTEELARYLLVCTVMLGTGIGVHRGGNIGIEALINAVSPLWRKVFAIIMNCCCLLLFGEMIRYGWRVIKITSRQTSPSMQISMGIPYGVIFVAVIIIFLHVLVQLLDVLTKPAQPAATSEA